MVIFVGDVKFNMFFVFVECDFVFYCDDSFRLFCRFVFCGIWKIKIVLIRDG